MKARGKSSSSLRAVGSIRSPGTPIGQETPAPLRAFPPPPPALRGWSRRSEPSSFSLTTQAPNPLSSAPPITLIPDALPGRCRNSLDRGERAALWSAGSSVNLPQKPGRGPEMSSIPIASPSGPWRLSASPRAVLFCWWKEHCDRWGARHGRPIAGVPQELLSPTCLRVTGRDEFS
jgi:hypothetical protein